MSGYCCRPAWNRREGLSVGSLRSSSGDCLPTKIGTDTHDVSMKVRYLPEANFTDGYVTVSPRQQTREMTALLPVFSRRNVSSVPILAASYKSPRPRRQPLQDHRDRNLSRDVKGGATPSQFGLRRREISKGVKGTKGGPARKHIPAKMNP